MTINNGEPAIIHYGVKGMKWGVRNADRPTTREIKDARARVNEQNRDFRKDRKAIKKGPGTRAEKREDIRNLKIDTLANPDRLTALKMTTGEKYLLAALAPVAPVSVAANLAAQAAVKNQLQDAQAAQAYRQQRDRERAAARS